MLRYLRKHARLRLLTQSGHPPLIRPMHQDPAKIATGVRMNWLAVRCLLRQSRA